MSIWLVIALSVIALGIVAGIIANKYCQKEKLDFSDCLAGAFVVCVFEGIVYIFTKLISWVAGWNADLIVKICFVAMPIILILIVIFAIMTIFISGHENKYDNICSAIFGLLALLFVASAIMCAVFAWIPSNGWKIGILVFFAIPFVLMLSALIYLMFCKKNTKKQTSGGSEYVISSGPSCEHVEYYSSKKEYERMERRRAHEEQSDRYRIHY